jgi:hypothetical protein
MTRSGKRYTSAQKAAARWGLPGPAPANASRSTTNKVGLEIESPTLIRWWVSATTATTSSDVTQRWRMTVDGC